MNWCLFFLAMIPILGIVASLPSGYDFWGEDPVDVEEEHGRERRQIVDDYFIKTKPATRPHDFARVLNNSILFYEAQRSGKLPKTNRIAWRDDSCVHDVGNQGEDLDGGWYDAGDNVKFNFPMAWSTSVLAWGFIEFMDAYEEAGLKEDMLDSIRWTCDYFIKCHTDSNVYYYQVGDADVDHKEWNRPEDLTYERTPFRVKGTDKGTDVVGLAAAALGSCAVAFKQAGKGGRAAIYRDEALDLYRMATRRLGTYKYGNYYQNVKWEDELVWASIWVYRASGEEKYLEEAVKMYEKYALKGRSWNFAWGDSREGSKLLLYQLTNDDMYKDHVENYLDCIMPFTSPQLYTPRGLFHRSDWGSLRYSAGVSLIALVAAKHGMKPNVYREFACNQTNYMLGDHEHHSFVIGYGKDPPCRPHHRASSCPGLDEPCTWANAMLNEGCNYHELTGALVGGPDKNDEWLDKRGDYYKNEVACDYNAPFQGVMAGLHKLRLDRDLPPACFILNSRV
ncbi:endoglucanase F-like [Glandiceps talaboti]